MCALCAVALCWQAMGFRRNYREVMLRILIHDSSVIDPHLDTSLYLPSARRLAASSRAHAVALVSGLAFRPKNRIPAAPNIPRYHGASQSSHFRDWPFGGGSR